MLTSWKLAAALALIGCHHPSGLVDFEIDGCKPCRLSCRAVDASLPDYVVKHDLCSFDGPDYHAELEAIRFAEGEVTYVATSLGDSPESVEVLRVDKKGRRVAVRDYEMKNVFFRKILDYLKRSGKTHFEFKPYSEREFDPSEYYDRIPDPRARPAV